MGYTTVSPLALSKILSSWMVSLVRWCLGGLRDSGKKAYRTFLPMDLASRFWSFVGNWFFSTHRAKGSKVFPRTSYTGWLGSQLSPLRCLPPFSGFPLLLGHRTCMRKSQGSNWCHFAPGSPNWSYLKVSIPKNAITYFPSTFVCGRTVPFINSIKAH